MRIIGDADTAWLGDSLKARCDVHTIAENVINVAQDIPEVDANPQYKALGFSIDDGPGTQRLYGTPAYPNYDGWGEDRVVFTRDL